MTQTEDHLYINKVVQGDSNAYAYLVNKYKRMAFTIALRIHRNTEDAEDTTQESFIKAFKKIHSFKKDSKFSTWLYTIVYRTAIYNLRKKSIPTEQINEDIIQNKYTVDEDFDDELKTQQQLKLVNEAINKLPKMESLLITLFYKNENSVLEIKEITGLSESNIKVKLYRARNKMKKQLKNAIEAASNNA